MTIERAIQILDPKHREHYDSVETVNEACRMGIAALRAQQKVENPEPLTNAGRIRAMSDEELVNVVPCPLGFSMFRCPIDRKCGDCKREWLKQPPEKGDT